MVLNNELSDEQIVSMAQNGNTEAFEVIVHRYQGRLLRYGRRILFNHADLEDLVQEVFIKTYRNLRSFDTSRKFSSWIYRIAHNEFVNHGKKLTRQLIDYFDLEVFLPHATAPADIEKNFDEEQTREIVEKSLSQLDEKYREPLILYYYESLDYKEIAEVLKIPVSTVGIRIMRAKQLMKTYLPKNHG